jgi:hypothetical protein
MDIRPEDCPSDSSRDPVAIGPAAGAVETTHAHVRTDASPEEPTGTAPGESYGTRLELIAGYRVHPLASKFPLIVGKEFDDLVEAAARAGRLYPVETHKGLLIDGRNRLRVQEELRRRGIEIDLPVVEWEPSGDETVEEHIWSVNANRRHQTADQLAVIALAFLPAIRAAREAQQVASRFGKSRGNAAASKAPPPPGAPAEDGGRTSAEKDAASSAGCLAALANVSHYKARRAIALHDAVEAGEVSEDELDAVLAGEKPLSAAAPRRTKVAKKKARPEVWDEGDDEEIVIDAAPTPSEAEARRRWTLQASDFAIADLPEWRRLFMKVIGDEQQMYDS